MTTKDFKLPDLGEGVHEGRVLRVMVKPGEVVREDQPLMEIETDKAAVVIPCPYAGTVQTVHVGDGQMVHVGDVMVTIGAGAAPHHPHEQSKGSEGPAASAARSSSSPKNTLRPAAQPPSPQRSPVNGRGSTDTAPAPPPTAKPQVAAFHRRNPASPAIRKLARSLGLDIETIRGSGPGGRVQRQDVEDAANGSFNPTESQRAVANSNAGTGVDLVVPPSRLPAPGLRASSQAIAARVAHAPLPESMLVEPQGQGASDAWGRIVKSPLSQARKTIAQVMTQSWSTIPHATDFDEADVTELEKLRKGYSSPDAPDRKITLLAFVVRAIVRALQRFPEFNAHVDMERGETNFKRYINIAIGTHTPRGLVPMVLRDADQLSIPQISDALMTIAEKARAAMFAVNDTRGGTYTISNAGAMGGSRWSTPIITPGQAAVLAVGRAKWMPWVLEGEPGSGQPRAIAPRLILPLSHSIDHRLLDGGQEIAFMQHVIGDLQNPARLLL